MSLTGLFELKTPENLFRKLEHDLQRLEAEPLNIYAAFDYFVTAEHMLDWVHPNNPSAQSAEFRPFIGDMLPLGKWLKAFQATNKRHKSVDDAKRHGGAFSSSFGGSYDTARLEIHLKGTAEAALGSEIEVTDLAKRVLAYWRKRLGL